MTTHMLEDSDTSSGERAAGDRIRTVTSATFAALVTNGEGPIVVEFMSYGCAHCRVLEPIIQEVAKVLTSKVTIFRVNVGAERELAARFEIQGTPTLLMVLDGEEVGRAEGPRPTVAGIEAAITQSFG